MPKATKSKSQTKTKATAPKTAKVKARKMADPKTFDEYLTGISDDKRNALEKLRKIIHSAAPGAEEYISYGLAAFKHNGRPLVALGASQTHCALYLMSGTTVKAHEKELAKYDTSKGTIRFQPRKPLPATLVRKLVRSRISENERK